MDIRAAEFRANPYPTFRRLRAERPVCRIEPHGHWAVARYDDVLAVLRNHRLFSSAGIGGEEPEGPRFLAHTRAMIGTDPPEHARLRAIVSRAFTPGRVLGLEGRIRAIASELLDALPARESFDFVSEFSAPLPIVAISELIGIDPARRRDFKRWTDTFLTWRATGRDVAKEAGEMFGYFTEIIAERRREPKDDLVSALVHACDAQERLTPQEILSFLRLLLVAGTETTTNLIGNAMLALLAHPAEWEKVRAERALVPALVEEALRYDGPVVSLTRRVTFDTEIAGVRIGAGELVLPLLASANHDESRFARPERFDVGRVTKGHLAFAEGIHFCMGAPLARLQARIAFEEIFTRFEALSLVDDVVERTPSFFFRGPVRLGLTA